MSISHSRFAACLLLVSVYACSPRQTVERGAPELKPASAEIPATAPIPSQIVWAKDWTSAKAQAAASKKPIMLDFYTSWCGWCKVLDQKTFPDARVVRTAQQVIAVKINGETPEGAALVKTYGIRGFPAIIFTDPAGGAIGVLSGYYPPEEFAPQMQQIIDQHKNSKG